MSSYSRACKLIRPTHSNRQIDDDSMYTRSRHGRHGPFGGPEGPGRGFGGPGRGFGGPFGGPPWGGPGGRGPGGPGGRHGGRRRRGEVRTALLLLLAEEPRNGYQLMQEIEERSGGRWRPSPGSVYPALSQLEDEGLVKAVEGEPGRVFEITDAGREQVQQQSGQAPPWEPEDETSEPSLSSLRNLFASTAAATWQVAREGDKQQIAAACALLSETRRGLYRLLAEEPVDDAGDGGDSAGQDPPAS